MFVIRAVELADVGQLHELAELTTFGLTTLPKNREVLEARVKQSLRAFEHLEDAGRQGDLFLFVMEEVSTRRLVGTAGIVTKVGGFKPFYAFQIVTDVQHSPTLNVSKEHELLHLVKEHDGPSEIGSLFLRQDFRGGGNGRTLSLSRFLFMATYPQLFEKQVIAEMRGVVDEHGHSPFWDALGEHFFGMDYPNADMLSLVNKDFIDELMPRHPIYTCLLPVDAREAIGQVNPLTLPARRMLEDEGFQFRNLVDIFEAGPVIQCDREQIRAVRESRVRTVASIIHSPTADRRSPFFLLATVDAPFRVTSGHVVERSSEIEIDANVADALQVAIGGQLRVVECRPV